MLLADQPIAVVVLDGQAEFFGAGLEVLVVVAALAGGVLDAAGVGQGVGGFVQEGAEDLAGVRRSPSPLIMISVRCSPATFHRPGAWWPSRACLPSVPLAMMMTAGGISGCQRRISSQMSSRTFRIRLAACEPLLCADPFPARVPLPGLVYPDHGLYAEVVRGAVEPVVAASPVRVGEGVVGFGDLPEPLSGVGAVVHVRVVLLGQLAVGRLDLRGSGAGFDAEQRVVVLVLGFHGRPAVGVARLSSAGRSCAWRIVAHLRGPEVPDSSAARVAVSRRHRSGLVIGVTYMARVSVRAGLGRCDGACVEPCGRWSRGPVEGGMLVMAARPRRSRRIPARILRCVRRW